MYKYSLRIKSFYRGRVFCLLKCDSLSDAIRKPPPIYPQFLQVKFLAANLGSFTVKWIIYFLCGGECVIKCRFWNPNRFVSKANFSLCRLWANGAFVWEAGLRLILQQRWQKVSSVIFAKTCSCIYICIINLYLAISMLWS